MADCSMLCLSVSMSVCVYVCLSVCVYSLPCSFLALAFLGSYMYVCLSVCLCLHVSVYVCLSLCLSVSMCVCLYRLPCSFLALALLGSYMSVCLYVSVYLCLCLSVSLSVCVYVCLSMSVYVGCHVHSWRWLSSAPICLSVSTCLCLCLSVSLSLCVYVSLSVCRLPCSFLALALLGSYAIQSDLGDYSPQEHGTGCGYLQDIKFAHRQGDELLDKIAELHKTHRYRTGLSSQLVKVFKK